MTRKGAERKATCRSSHGRGEAHPNGVSMEAAGTENHFDPLSVM